MATEARTETAPLGKTRQRPGVVPLVGLSLVLAVLLWLGYNLYLHPADWFRVLLIGITLGALYGIVALGYTLVYGILELINFAHGDVFMLGGMFSSSMIIQVFALGNNPSLGSLIPALLGSLAVAMIGCGLLNVTIERIAYKPLRNAPRLAPLITAIGMSFIVQNIGNLWTSQELHFPSGGYVQLPAVLPNGKVFSVSGVEYRWKQFIVLLIVVPLLLALVYLVQMTRQGKAMRAVAQDKDAAAMMGIDVNRTISFTFLIAGLLAGAAGLIYVTYITTLRFDQGFQLGLIAFTSAVFGGIGNLPGAVLGATLIGLIQAFNEGLTWHAPGSTWTYSLVFSILILILVFRPEGLLGERTPEGG